MHIDKITAIIKIYEICYCYKQSILFAQCKF